MRQFQEVALEVMYTVYPVALTSSMVEKLAEKLGADMESRNCGGFWQLTLMHSGLIEFVDRNHGESSYALSQDGCDLIWLGSQTNEE